MTQWPTVTNERTGNKGDPPQHREPKPTRDNPLPAVRPPTPPEPSGLKKPKEIIQKEGGRKRKENKETPEMPHKTKETTKETMSGGSRGTSNTTTRSLGCPPCQIGGSYGPNRHSPNRQTPKHTNVTDKHPQRVNTPDRQKCPPGTLNQTDKR